MGVQESLGMWLVGAGCVLLLLAVLGVIVFGHDRDG